MTKSTLTKNVLKNPYLGSQTYDDSFEAKYALITDVTTKNVSGQTSLDLTLNLRNICSGLESVLEVRESIEAIKTFNAAAGQSFFKGSVGLIINVHYEGDSPKIAEVNPYAILKSKKVQDNKIGLQ
ncbi:MAG: hypothetical protein ACP5N2_05765 [Candidatus Nanoarchaeia archaeon]